MRAAKRELKKSSAFKSDWKREHAGKGVKAVCALEEAFIEAVSLLLADAPPPAKWRDHALTGDLKGLRDLHVRPDLVLLYHKSEHPEPTLHLVRLGSHAELGL